MAKAKVGEVISRGEGRWRRKWRGLW